MRDHPSPRRHPLTGLVLIFTPLLHAVSGCGEVEPAEATVPPPMGGACATVQSKTGVGTFDTLWGVAKLDYRWDDGKMIHDGDIVLDPASEIVTPPDHSAPGLGEASQPLLRGSKKWDMVGGEVTVPYGYAADVSPARQKKIRDAMDEWESEIAFVHFVPSSVDTGRRVKFVTWNKNYCMVNGSANDEVIVYTSAACGWITFVHELGHVLGFKHEQKRDDRKDYVDYDKTKTCEPGEFSFDGGEKLGDYDTDSIMHYPSCMFAKGHSTCKGTSPCSSQTPAMWVLSRTSGSPYIPWWEQRSKGDVIRSEDKCNFKSLYDIDCGDGPPGSKPDCKPDTCAALGKDCGAIDDGCKKTVDCGSCGSGTECGGSGIPNVCGDSKANAFPMPAWGAGTIQNLGRCLEVGSATNGAEIRMSGCVEGLLHQGWHVTNTTPEGCSSMDTTGSYQWKNDESGQCAEVAGIAPATGLTQEPCRSSEERQLWRLNDTEIVNGKTGRCLDVLDGHYEDGQILDIMPCNGKAQQKFTYEFTTHEIKAEGWCVDARSSGEIGSGNDVVLRECDGSVNQRWLDERAGFVSQAHPDLCMHIEGGGAALDGAKIEVAECSDGAGEMWGLRGRFEQWDDNYCLTSNEGDGQVTISACDGSAAQVFTRWSPD